MIDTKDAINKKYHLHLGHSGEVEIPNMGRVELAELFFELGFTIGAEIGVEKGLFSEVLLLKNPNLYLYCIDSWSTTEYDPKLTAIHEATGLFERYYEEALARLAAYNCKIIKKTSMEALSDFDDNSLDFVYIDANHDFVNVTCDVHYWSKKVRVGGIVAGHDYAYFQSNKLNHVKHVLPAFTKAYGIKPLYIVGAAATGVDGVIRDKFRSWFFIKK